MTHIKQVRIFAPRNHLFADALWAETLIGRIIVPLVSEYEARLNWFWFSRYDCTSEVDSNDCDISQIPNDFMHPESKHYRSVRFRYSLQSDCSSLFVNSCAKLITDVGCRISGFLPYDLVADLGGDDNLEEPRTVERRQRRAHLVVENYCSIAKLVIHALAGPDPNGCYSLPHHADDNPTHPTPFNRFHHIFCNVTDIPLYVTTAHHAPGGALNAVQHELRYHRVWF